MIGATFLTWPQAFLIAAILAFIAFVMWLWDR